MSEANLVDSSVGCRKTKQRKAIVDALVKSDWHPTADEVYQEIRKELPRISMGTVYRNLQLLSEAGVIKTLDMCGTQRRYESVTKDHCHIRCVQCARVEDLDVSFDRLLEEAAKGTTEFDVRGVQVEFYGICPECSKKVDNEELS